MEIHDWRHKFLQGNNRDQFDHKRDDFDPRIYIPNHWSLLHMYDYSDHGFKTTSDHFSDNFELWSLNLKNLCARHATRVCVMLANKSVMSVTFGDVRVSWSSRLLDRLEYDAMHARFPPNSQYKSKQKQKLERWLVGLEFTRENNQHNYGFGTNVWILE